MNTQLPEHFEHASTGPDITMDNELTEQPLEGMQLPVYPEEELMDDIRYQYDRDPFYKKILDSPKEFHNFEVENGIIRIKLNDQTLVCIPDIKLDE
jgi:hypothetical protein